MFLRRFLPGTAVLVAISLSGAACDADPAPPKGPSRLPSGITWYEQLQGTLNVFDAGDGRILHQATVTGGERPWNLTVSADGTTAVGLRKCTLQLYRWTGQTFGLVREHPQPDGLCFEHATFRDGRFRIETKRQPRPEATDRNPWFTLDPAAPQTLRQEDPVDVEHSVKLTVAGHPAAGGVLRLNGLRVNSAELNEVSGPAFKYYCSHPIDATRFFCVASRDELHVDKAQPFGSLAIATFDLQSHTLVTIEQVVPASKIFVVAAALSPDGKDVAFSTDPDGRWHRITRNGKLPPASIAGAPAGDSSPSAVQWL
jgi:hypothetical protein